MRKGVLAIGVVAIIGGLLSIVMAYTVAVETTSLFGWFVKTPNPYMFYSGIGLILTGILLVTLGAATSKKVSAAASTARRKTARARVKEEIDVIKILKRSFKSLIDELGFIILYLLPFAVVLIAFVHIWLSFGTLTPWATIRTSSEIISLLRDWIVWIVVYGIAYMVLFVCADAAIILKASARERGKEMGLDKTLVKGIRYVPRLFVALVLVGLIVVGPLFLFIGLAVLAPLDVFLAVLLLAILVWFIPMFYIGIRLALFAQACVLKDLGPVGCLKECWRMTKGNFWLIFVTGLLLGIVSMLIGLVPQVGLLIAMVLVGPAGIIAYTLIYLGLSRTRIKRGSSVKKSG